VAKVTRFPEKVASAEVESPANDIRGLFGRDDRNLIIISDTKNATTLSSSTRNSVVNLQQRSGIFLRVCRRTSSPDTFDKLAVASLF
jgi:hypothetical protein